MSVEELLNYSKVCDAAIELYASKANVILKSIKETEEEQEKNMLSVDLDIAKIRMKNYMIVKEGIVKQMISAPEFVRLYDSILKEREKEEKEKSMII